MKFEDCAPKVKVFHKIYGYGKIYKVNTQNDESVFNVNSVLVDFDGIKRIFYNSKNIDRPYHVSELKQVLKNTLSENQIIRYSKSENVYKIYKELKKKYNIPTGYEEKYMFTKNKSTYITYKTANNVPKIIVTSATCDPRDKFDVRIGLEVAVKRLAQNLGVYKEKVKEDENWIPENGQVYWSVALDTDKNSVYKTVWSHFCSSSYKDQFNVAMRNCFKTEKEAKKHIDETKEKYKKLFEYAKTLNT